MPFRLRVAGGQLMATLSPRDKRIFARSILLGSAMRKAIWMKLLGVVSDWRRFLQPSILTRKVTCIAVLLSICTSSTFAQERPPVALFSFSDTSCGAWVSSAGNEAIRAQYSYWFRGFVSGYNHGNPYNQVELERMPDSQTLALFVDQYCRENPLQPFVIAAWKLVAELRDHPEPKKPTKR